MADSTASVSLDHVAGDEMVEEERLDLGGELVCFRSLVVEAVGTACHERAIHGFDSASAVNAAHIKGRLTNRL